MFKRNVQKSRAFKVPFAVLTVIALVGSFYVPLSVRAAESSPATYSLQTSGTSGNFGPFEAKSSSDPNHYLVDGSNAPITSSNYFSDKGYSPIDVQLVQTGGTDPYPNPVRVTAPDVSGIQIWAFSQADSLWFDVNEVGFGDPSGSPISPFVGAHVPVIVISPKSGNFPITFNLVDVSETPQAGTVVATGSTNAVVVGPVPCNGSTFDTFALGSVNGQGGWSSTGPYDQAVVDNTYGYSSYGCKSLRLSNAVTSGAFGDQTFSPSTPNEAGEADATNNEYSGGTRQNRFEGQFDIASTMGTEQAGLKISVSPDRGDGSRMSYLRFEDSESGINVFFDDVQGTVPMGVDGCGTTVCANFVETQVATDLNRAVPHTIKFVMDFVNGPSNDVVKVYIDGSLVHTGTSWEDYYRFDPEAHAEQTPRTTDSLLFRAGGTAAPATNGKGFLFDNVNVSSGQTPVAPTPTPTPDQGGGSVVGTQFLGGGSNPTPTPTPAPSPTPAVTPVPSTSVSPTPRPTTVAVAGTPRPTLTLRTPAPNSNSNLSANIGGATETISPAPSESPEATISPTASDSNDLSANLSQSFFSEHFGQIIIVVGLAILAWIVIKFL